MTFKPPPLLDSSSFFAVMRFESLYLGCSNCPESLRRVLRWFFPFLISFCPAEPPTQCRARVRVKRCHLGRRAVAFLSLFNFALPTPSSAQSRGATRVPCSRVTWSFIFCVLYLFYFISSTKHFSPRGAVGIATFYPGYLSFPRLTPRRADGPWEVFRMTSPLC